MSTAKIIRLGLIRVVTPIALCIMMTCFALGGCSRRPSDKNLQAIFERDKATLVALEELLKSQGIGLDVTPDAIITHGAGGLPEAKSSYGFFRKNGLQIDFQKMGLKRVQISSTMQGAVFFCYYSSLNLNAGICCIEDEDSVLRFGKVVPNIDNSKIEQYPQFKKIEGKWYVYVYDLD